MQFYYVKSSEIVQKVVAWVKCTYAQSTGGFAQ